MSAIRRQAGHMTILSEDVIRSRSPGTRKTILRKARRVLGWLENRVHGNDWVSVGGDGPPERYIPQRDKIRAYKNLVQRIVEEMDR